MKPHRVKEKTEKLISNSRLKDTAEDNKQVFTLATAVFLSYIVLHIVFGRHQLPAYDAYTFMSFAEHYAESWFTTSIPSQAHGLQIASYPPLLFQVMALLSFIPFLNMTHIYILLTSLGATAISIASFYLLDELFNLDERINGLVVLFLAFSPGLTKSAIIHGQMTTIIGIALGLTSATLFYKTIKGQEKLLSPLILSLVLTAYIHHFSLLLTGMILAIISLANFRDVVSSIDHLSTVGAIAGAVIFLGLLTMIEEILFGFSQGTIPHASRRLLQSTRVFNQMFASHYGISIVGVGLLLKSKFGPLSAKLIAVVFMTLGLGLVTPIPKILFGEFSNVLVYTRFSLIASLFLSGMIGIYITEKVPSKSLVKRIDFTHILVALFILLSLGNLLWANNIHLGSYTGYDVSDPDQTSTAIQYLNTEASTDYLYVTYGHRQPADEIQMNTNIPTLDTGYYRGREIEEFKTFGKLDRLSKDKFATVIETSDNLSLKYILSFDKELDPLINKTEWRQEKLDNNVSVWVNKDVPKYERQSGKKHILFSTVPILTLLVTGIILCSQTARNKIEQFVELARKKVRSTGKHFSDKKAATSTILLMALLVALPSLITKGLPSGIDTPLFLFQIETMSSMLEEYGKIFNWSNSWYNGYLFMSLYSPIIIHLIHSFETIIGDITFSYNIVRFSITALLAGTVYKLSENISNDIRVHTLASTLIIFSYPIYSNLYTVGRISSALGLPIYLLLIHVLLRENIFSRELNRSHIYLGLGAAALFLVHSMMAYLFIFTGLIFAFVYLDRVRNLGIKPLLAISTLPSILCLSYLSKLVQHMSLTETSWYVGKVPFSIYEQLKLSFTHTPPAYLGLVYAALLTYGTIKYFKSDNRFLKFSVLNSAFFYLLFWARNFKISSLIIPFSSQFDLAEFQILFVAFGVFIASYGFKYLLEENLSGIDETNKNILTIAVICITIVTVAPMLTQSANWTPEFSGEIEKAPIENEYRALGTGMRTWHSYLLHKAEIPNTIGWFDQANPNKHFTRALKSSGGMWYGGDINYNKYNSTVRKNLMEISNTKYIIAATGDWIKPSVKQQVVGPRNTSHILNEKLITDVSDDKEFKQIHSAEHLEVYELERDMSYCQGLNPVWIQDNYEEKSLEFFQTSDALPELPIEGEPRDLENGDVEVSCHKEDPYTISINANGTGWVLVKESYYPFWERSDGGEIIDGYGFQIIHIDGEKDLELEYQPRNISTLSPNDIKSFTGTVFG